ncbi:hypothetical protein NECAME_13626 [Necator americanus]|uniref:MTTase N-terminal domain-containing protein n=1 Tax=Necator americanus TaxID=51031 RepID=W2STQ4_NECAM|nr:hypothetical protein NECAME_13626 [Necator americanus]ETN73134.1 hypothetical protein NECAME_13626 [Necator americanus]
MNRRFILLLRDVLSKRRYGCEAAATTAKQENRRRLPNGCMAERVRHGLLSKKGLVDVVAGPDAYRDLPRLLAVARAGSNAINVQLSVEETYADVKPVRVDQNAKTAFV